MRIITVKMPEAYLRDLDELVKSGAYPSRSEAIRAAVKELLGKELYRSIDDRALKKKLQSEFKHSSKHYGFGCRPPDH
ncbi:MAG: type II toxin-antitoxin system ParD family antitoxin [Candidatus Nezhaarchaeota archaeon]|nr:type II toxin-antitoxin system ParD family antitoxin [Candidatus Nezhaarchaeota archaeon]MCX8142481.1 type II toxin-antitoxin system ParD family antitoxin [Candidatus Nezhaarchaeota archaeon]